jgi:hypothetical protein
MEKKSYKRGLHPFVIKFKPSVDTSRLGQIITPKCCSLKSNHTSKKYGGFDANDKGGAMYFNHLINLCTDAEMCELLDIRNDLLQNVSALLGTPLYPFESSMWNVFYLAYSGVDGKFGWHYDHENDTDFRVLVCIEATDGAGAVEYIDAHGHVQSVHLAAGEAYVLKGSQTYHRVRPNTSEDDRRIMVGFHCSTLPHQRTLNLCYFANLTSWKISPALRILMNQDKYRTMVSTPSPAMCNAVYH